MNKKYAGMIVLCFIGYSTQIYSSPRNEIHSKLSHFMAAFQEINTNIEKQKRIFVKSWKPEKMSRCLNTIDRLNGKLDALKNDYSQTKQNMKKQIMNLPDISYKFELIENFINQK